MQKILKSSSVLAGTSLRNTSRFQHALSRKAGMASSSVPASSGTASKDPVVEPSMISSSIKSNSTSTTPMEDVIREKLTSSLQPSTLEIHNDSHLHTHHKAMADSTSQETHFRITITSPAFVSKFQPARHRIVYTLLKEEMARVGGIHALQLKTLTPDEEEKQKQKKTTEVEKE